MPVIAVRIWGWRGQIACFAYSALSLLTFAVGCSSSSSTGDCRAACSDLCRALAACDVPQPAACESQCNTGLGSVDCSSARPASQLTCRELTESYACTDYCATLCTRAPTCGAFDTKQCATGCASLSPAICNAASVAARSCDQLKPEIRSYQDAAQAEQGGGHVEVAGSGSPGYGLCASAADCPAPLGCSAATNTCAPCEADVECKQSFGGYVCSLEQMCTKVDCTSDADCYGGRFCDPTLHVCGECHTDADCSPSAHVCNPATAACVMCVTNSDCSADFPRCESSPALSYCSACKTDADCAVKAATPLCGALGCVACKTNTDCKEPSRPTCDESFGTCK